MLMRDTFALCLEVLLEAADTLGVFACIGRDVKWVVQDKEAGLTSGLQSAVSLSVLYQRATCSIIS